MHKANSFVAHKQEKIYTNSGVPALLKSEHSKNVDHNHNEYSNHR
jgi:hypothetical protein